MAYKTRANFLSQTAGKFTSGSDQWTGQEVEDMGLDAGNSVQWQDTEITLTDGATITWNYNDGQEAVVTLGGNRNLAFSNLPADRVVYMTLRVLQDGTGSRTLTLPTPKKTNGGTINPTASAETIIGIRFDGVAGTYRYAIAQYS